MRPLIYRKVWEKMPQTMKDASDPVDLMHHIGARVVIKVAADCPRYSDPGLPGHATNYVGRSGKIVGKVWDQGSHSWMVHIDGWPDTWVGYYTPQELEVVA